MTFYLILSAILVIFLLPEIISYISLYCLFSHRKKVSKKAVNKNDILIINDTEQTNYIPKNIIQTYKTDNIPDYVENNLKKRNPDWKYIFMDDKSVTEFLDKEYDPKILKTFNSFKKGAHRADLFRLCWLYKNGGVYIDIDTDIVEPLDNIINMMDGKLFSMPQTHLSYGYKRLLNSFIVCNKGNIKVKRCIENIIKIDPEELDNAYTHILHVMEDTLGEDFEYLFEEKNKYSNRPYILRGEEPLLYIKNKKIGKSCYDDYNRKKGFGRK